MMPFNLRDGRVYLPAEVPLVVHPTDDGSSWALREATDQDLADVEAVEHAERQSETEWDNAAGSCRSCGAPIVWLTMHGSGRRMPVDAEPAGSLVVRFGSTGRRGKVVSAFTSHFATCPDADRHRRR